MKEKKKRINAVTIEIRRQAFLDKIDLYERLTLEELKALYNHPDKKKRPGGIYREALIEVVRRKQQLQLDDVVKDATEEPQQELPHNELETP